MADRCSDVSVKQRNQVDMAMRAEDVLKETGLQKRQTTKSLPESDDEKHNDILETVPGSDATTTSHEGNIIKHTVLLLMASHKMAFGELLLTLTQLMPECKHELSSEKSLLAILEKYDIFGRGKTGVCLEAIPSEAYVTKIDGKYGFIGKATDKHGVFFHQSAVYIPPKANADNEYDCQLKVKSHVKYISVSDSPRPSYFFPAKRAVLVWLACDGPEVKKLPAQVMSSVLQTDSSAKSVPVGVTSPTSSKCHKEQSNPTNSNDAPVCAPCSVRQDVVMKQGGESGFGSEMYSDLLTTQIIEIENFTGEMNPTHDIMTMVFLFMSMLTEKVICIPRLVLASYPGLPTFVTEILTDATLCRAFTSRHSTFLKLGDDDKTLSFLNMPSDIEKWSIKDARVTRVWPNSATAESNDGRIYIHRQSFFLRGSTSSDQGSQVPKRKLTSVLELKDKITCLTVPYQVPALMPVLPGAKSSRYQTILAWESSFLNQALCCLLGRKSFKGLKTPLSPKSMDISEKATSHSFSQDASDNWSKSAQRPSFNITEELPVSLQCSTVKEQNGEKLEEYVDGLPTANQEIRQINLIQIPTTEDGNELKPQISNTEGDQKMGNLLSTKKKGTLISTTADSNNMTRIEADMALGCSISTIKSDQEMEHLTTKDKKGTGDLTSTSEESQHGEHSILTTHKSCASLTKEGQLELDSIKETLDFTESDDCSSLITCFSDFHDPLLQLGESAMSLPASDPEEVTFIDGKQEVTQQFTRRLRKRDTGSKRKDNGHLEKANGHHETKEVVQDIPITSEGLKNEYGQYLGKALLEVYNLLKCIEGHVKPTTRSTSDKGCQAGAPEVERKSISCQTACVAKANSDSQTLSTGHIVISEYFTE